MISDIITILNSDSTLTSLLGAANRVVPNYPFDASNVAQKHNAIVYEFYTSSNDGKKAHYRLTLRIIAPTLVDCDNIENRIDALILTYCDKQLNDSTLSVVQNGGGSLKDPDTGYQHRILYFDILKKATYHA